MKYYRPENLSQYFDYLQEIDGLHATTLAGGTDLLPQYEQGVPISSYLIDIKKIEELRGIVEREKEIEIGALTTIAVLGKNSLVKRNCHALWMATREFAGEQIRHRATLGGNICNASPAGDTLPSLYALRARLKIVGPDSERQLPIQDFILGPGEVDLNAGEILQSIILTKQSYRSTFYKLGLRQAMSIAVVNFAIVHELKNRGFSYLSVAAGAVAPTVVYLDRITEAVRENQRALDDVISLVDEDIAPITDIRGTAEYRKTVLKNMLRYYLTGLLEEKDVR